MTKDTFNEVAKKIEQIDLGPIIFTLVERDEGECWSFEKAVEVEKQYRNFLKLIALYPNLEIVPTKDIDTFWHTHILDTEKYMNDCEETFGYFVHHFPYFGLRGEADEEEANEAFSKTQKLYKEHFGVSIFGSARCSSHCKQACGKKIARCSSHCKQACGKKKSLSEIRPTM